MGTPIEQLHAIRRIRDYAVALSLAPTPISAENAEQAIVQRQVAERESWKHGAAAAKDALARQLERLDAEIAELETSSGGPRLHEQLAALRCRRQDLVAKIAAEHDQIRRLRQEYEDQLVAGEMQRLDDEERELSDRASRTRVARHQARVEAWRQAGSYRDAQRRRLAAVRDRLEAELQRAKDQIERVREPLVSRTVAGFLLWAGYTAIAASGAAVAYLLTPKSGDQDAIGALAQSMMNVAGAMKSALPGWLLLPISTIVLVLLLGSVILVFFGCDKLIHHFDRNWRRRRQREHGFSRSALGLPSPEINRRAYVQTLALLPFAYIVGLLFIVLTYRGGTTESAANIAAVAPAVVRASIGTVVTLLTAAVFILYAIKIIERRAMRTDASTARRSWEITIPPLLVIGAFAVATSRPEPDRYAWSGVALFMVMSSIGLAYGVVYRGMFRDVDELSRQLRTCEEDIEALDGEPEVDEPDRAERHDVTQIRRSYRRRTQQMLDDARRRRAERRDARPDGTMNVRRALVVRLCGRGADLPQQSTSDWRIIDSDAAPEQTRRRAELQQELAGVDEEIADLTKRAAENDNRARLATARAEHRAAKAELATCDERAASEFARLLERQVLEIEEFRRAYGVGLAVRPAFEIMRDRSRATAEHATQYWRRAEGA
jgi:hypothetical protein